MQTSLHAVSAVSCAPRARLLLALSSLALALSGCGTGVDAPTDTIQFGEVFTNAVAVEERIAILNDGGRQETVESISWQTGTAFRLADPALPIALDNGAPYGFTFAFVPPDGGFQQWDDTATLTIASGNTTYQVQVSMTGLFTNGDFDGDGVVDEQYGCEGCDDCNDADATVYPGAEEICDGQDNTCDGLLGALEVDEDGDNFLICEGDCNDNNVAQNPSVAEQCDGLDNDCDGNLSPDEIDSDNDGYDACAGDCEEGVPSVNPGEVETCDGYDTDCSNAGAIPADEVDADNDGWFECNGECDDLNGSANPGQPNELCDGFDTDCDPTTNLDDDELDVDGDSWFVCNGDCDDGQPASYPGNPEVCDFIDNDCDGVVPANEVDVDGDLSPDCVDCDDTNPAVFPGAPDVCDAVTDNDCDSVADPNEVDDDGDSFSDCAGDCDDTDSAVNPSAAEVCDGIDNDCSGAPLATETFDSDGDGDLDCVDGDCPFWVDDDQTGTGLGTNGDPFATINEGIAAVANVTAAVCPTVVVQPGTYNGTVDFEDLELRLVAEEGPAVTTLDGQGVGPVVAIDQGQTAAVLAGFTITGGQSNFTNDYTGHGGGIYLDAAATIQNNVLYENVAAFHGGGLYGESGDVVLLDNVFEGNDADFDGGGAYIKNSDGLIEGNLFLDNEADDDGGGLFIGNGSLAEIRWNVFAENECTGVNDNTDQGWGGGILNHSGADTSIHNNLFVGNIAENAGALFVFDSAPEVVNNTAYDNHATTAGNAAGFRVFQGEFSNNALADGTGTGVHIIGSGAGVTFEYNAIWDFTDGAFLDDPVVPGDGDLIGVDGNIAVNPLFGLASSDFVWNDDLSLQSTSLLINAGDPTPFENDVDGTRNDIGAFGGPDGDWTPQ